MPRQSDWQPSLQCTRACVSCVCDGGGVHCAVPIGDQELEDNIFSQPLREAEKAEALLGLDAQVYVLLRVCCGRAGGHMVWM